MYGWQDIQIISSPIGWMKSHGSQHLRYMPAKCSLVSRCRDNPRISIGKANLASHTQWEKRLHLQGFTRYESINNLDTMIRRLKVRRQIVRRPPGLKQWILMHLRGVQIRVCYSSCVTYQLITYLLFQFFPSLQPSCLRTLHLWQGDKKVSIQGW